jgi:hypothetical protein
MANVICNFEGVSIKVVNSVTNTKLFVDDKLLDQWNALIAPVKKKLILKAVNYPFKSGSKTIEVYNKAMFSNKFMVCVNGEYVGGDRI